MTSTEAVDTGVQPSAFLDSSILVSLFQFWDACRQGNIPLDQAPNRGEQLLEVLASTGVATDALDVSDAEDAMRGRRSFQSLNASGTSYSYFSSQVCWAEVHHVLLEARGLERLVHQLVPYSLRMKRPQLVYRRSLRESDYVELETKMEEFRDTLKMDYSIDVIDVDNPAAGYDITHDDIWNSARAIWSHILMGVMDAYVCAAAIRVRADIFISSDGPLRGVLKQLRDPNSEQTSAVASLKQALGMETLAEFPEALGPGQPLTSSASLP